MAGQNKGKGKQRSFPPSTPSERSPLLPATSLPGPGQSVAVYNPSPHAQGEEQSRSAQRWRQPGWRSLLQGKTILFIITTIILSFFLLLALLLNSYKPTTFEIEHILPNAIIIDSPPFTNTSNRTESRSRDGDLIAEGLKSVRVLNMTDGGIWVEVNGTWAADLNMVFGIGSDYGRVAEAEISRLQEEEARRACDLARLYGDKQNKSPDEKAGIQSQQRCIDEPIPSSPTTYTYRGQSSPFFESLRSRLAKYAYSLIDPIEVVLPDGVEVWSDVNPFMEDKGKRWEKSRLLARIRVAEGSGDDGGDEEAEGAGIKVVGLFPGYPSASSASTSDKLGSSTLSIPLTSLLIHLAPPPSSTTSTANLLSQLKQYWIDGTAELKIKVPRVIVRTRREGGFLGWRKWVRRMEEGVDMPVEVEVPSIPGIPDGETNLAKLVQLRSYDIGSVEVRESDGSMTQKLGIKAMATAPNPFHGFDMTYDFPYELGFRIALPVEEESGDSSVARGSGHKVVKRHLESMAEVRTHPLTFGTGREFEVHMEGFVTVDIGRRDDLAGDETLSPALSTFLRNFLHGFDNLVNVQGLPYLPWNQTNDSLVPPVWLLDGLKTISANLSFPGPKPKPKLIRSVTIEGMKISEAGGKMRASGLVVAEIELPRQMTKIEVQVEGVLPDILVFDGPAGDIGDIDPGEPPYPAKAFGRIHPEDYLPASSEHSEEEGILIVRAPIHDVPIDILPGRDKVMSDFVSKIVFRGGALAGIKGKAAVQVFIHGLQSDVKVDDLPVTGQVVIGKPRG